jgi:hypothetical protein
MSTVRSNLCALSCLFVLAGSTFADINYTLTGSLGDVITFSLPQNPTALSPSPPAATCFLDDDCFSVWPVPVTLDGTLYSTATVSFYTPGDLGGITILAGGLGSAVLVNNDGPGDEQLFSGTVTNPTLENFTNLQLVQEGAFSPEYNEAFLLNASGATVTPEPGSYAALILGFGGVMLVVRSRRAKQRE